MRVGFKLVICLGILLMPQGSPLNFSAQGYGGELLPGVALWPENRWQSVSLGVNARW